MQCNEIMKRDIPWVTDGCSVARAASVMATHRVELLPVCGVDAHSLGVITDRDVVVRVIASGQVPELTRVKDVMTSPATFVPPDCPVERAAELMSKEGVSHLLVLGAGGRLEGIVGLNDLFHYAPEVCALETIRGIFAWHPSGPLASSDVKAAISDSEGMGQDGRTIHAPAENPARTEAESVARGGVNDLKEFPG